MTDAAQLREALVSKGLMDEAYYRANHGERIPPGESAVDHFVRVGHEAGHAPCEAFDPVLFRVLHGPAPPSAWPDRAEAEGDGRPAADFFPQLNFGVYLWRGKSNEDVKANLGEILDNPTRSVKLPTPFGVYKFRNPPSETVFKAIKAGRPISLVRMSHGFWDCCRAVDRIAGVLAADPRTHALSDSQRRALTVRMLATRTHATGNFAGDYLDTILDDLRDNPRDADFFTGISFKGGPTYEDSAFGMGPPRPIDLVRAERFTQLFSPYDRLYDAMIWKRWAILGGLRRLPEVLRRRPLIMVARKSFEVLAERLALPHLVMVDIPGERSQLIRREVLPRIEAAVQDQLERHPDRAPVVLFQSGASLSYWFIRRLRVKFPTAIYLDIGEALNIWCLDIAGANLWMDAYREQISKACLAEPS